MRLAALIVLGVLLTAPALADGRDGGRRAKGQAAKAAPAVATASVEAAPSIPDGHEPNIYRFGATYASQPSTSALACETACRNDNSCRAWSHVNAFVESPARCELKRAAGRTEENLAATSGVIRRGKTYLADAPRPTVLAGAPGTYSSSAPVTTTTVAGVSRSSAPAVQTVTRVPATAAVAGSEPKMTYSSAMPSSTPAGTMVTTASVAGSEPKMTYTTVQPPAPPTTVTATVPMNRTLTTSTPFNTPSAVASAPATTTRTVTTAPAVNAPAPIYYPAARAKETGGSTSYYPPRPQIILDTPKADAPAPDATPKG